MTMQETMWAVAAGVIIAAVVLWLLRTGLAFLVAGEFYAALGIVMLIVGGYAAVFIISGKVFGIHFEGNTLVRP
jgi:hypothetical protein